MSSALVTPASLTAGSIPGTPVVLVQELAGEERLDAVVGSVVVGVDAWRRPPPNLG